MKIQDKWDNFGEMCVACGHARKFHWETMPYGDVVMKRSDNPEMKCMWNFEIGKCEQRDLCGCIKHKQDFCVISGI